MNSKPLSPAKQALLEERLRGVVTAPAMVDTPRTAGELVLSPGQHRLWFLHQLSPDSRAYTMAQAWHLQGLLDTAALQRAFDAVIQRHAVLRQTFREQDGVPVPVIAPHLQVPIEALGPAQPVSSGQHAAVPAATGGPAASLDHAREIVSTLIRRPFDLQAGPLVRPFLVRLASDAHVFGLALHHIICDEWSLEILWRELSTFYSDEIAGRPPTLPPPALQYPDYALWQRDRLGEPVLATHVDYWRDRLHGLQPLDLPLDAPRPARRRFRGALETLSINAGTAVALARLAREQGVTNFVLLLAAFNVLLQRHTLSADIVVGTPVTGRIRPEFEGIIGFFLNSVVLRTDLSGDPPFHDLLRNVGDTVMEGLSHQDAPFEMLVDALQPRRGLSRNPLFQVMFTLQQPSDPPRLSPEMGVRSFPVETGGAKLDLTLFATELHDGLELTLEYDTDLFEQSTARLLLDRMSVLLDAIAADPGRRIGALPIMSDAEQRQLAEWSEPTDGHRAGELPAPDARGRPDRFGTERNAGSATTVLDRIRAQAARSPTALAVESVSERLTYGDLMRRARDLGRDLRRAGAGADVCVGVCAERSADMLVGILAVLESGGAYVPLDPSYPAERLRLILEDTRAPVVLLQRRFASRLETAPARILFIEEETRPAGIDADIESASDPRNGTPRVPDMADRDPAANTSPDRLAYVIHTSGSSGRPKGVAVMRRNLDHSTAARLDFYGEEPARFLLLPSFAFDSSVAGIFWTLGTGGTLVLPPPRIEQDPHALAALIAEQRVTHTLCLPSIWSALLEHAPTALLGSLRTVICAGEPLPTALARRHMAVVPAIALYNEYGPTEATVWCTVYRVPPDFAATRVPIGRPIPGARVHVLDEALRPVPIGVAGELSVGGAGVVRGYLGLEAATAERFVPDPFAGGDEDARLYRTGDRVRWRTDGNLEFLGRTDQQIKIRGYRIEPAEIEAVLRSHPNVRDCVVAPEQHDRPEPARSDQEPDSSSTVGDLVDALLALDPDEAERLLAEVETHAPDRRTSP